MYSAKPEERRRRYDNDAKYTLYPTYYGYTVHGAYHRAESYVPTRASLVSFWMAKKIVLSPLISHWLTLIKRFDVIVFSASYRTNKFQLSRTVRLFYSCCYGRLRGIFFSNCCPADS